MITPGSYRDIDGNSDKNAGSGAEFFRRSFPKQNCRRETNELGDKKGLDKDCLVRILTTVRSPPP